MSSYNAGAAHVEITPPVGTRLSGFAGRPTGNTGRRDPIRASALFLDCTDAGAAIITLDCIGLHPEDDARLRSAVAERLSIAPEAVLVACSHTHSGPATMMLRATGDQEVAWTETVLERAQEAAVLAQDAAVGAVLLHGSGYSFANINRRLPTRQGISLAPHPSGPCDPFCRVLMMEADGAPVALLVQYEMHPVSLGNQNLLVSADWVASFRDRVERALQCPVLFVQGCCGDVNPSLRGEEGCAAVGLDVAGSVLTALRRVHPVDPPRLAAAASDVAIPAAPLPSLMELDRVEARARETVERLRTQEGSLAAFHVAEAEVQWAERCREILLGTAAPRPLAAAVSALAIGEISLVGMPGEVFSAIGERVRSLAPNTWTLGYTNGNLGYLYPDEAYAAGGYEVDLAYRLYGELQAGEGTADALVNAAEQALAKVRS